VALMPCQRCFYSVMPVVWKLWTWMSFPLKLLELIIKNLNECAVFTIHHQYFIWFKFTVSRDLNAEDVRKKYIQFSWQKSSKPVVNPDIQKENAKVVDSFDVEDIGEKAAFCRCWRSKKVRCHCFVCSLVTFGPE